MKILLIIFSIIYLSVLKSESEDEKYIFRINNMNKYVYIQEELNQGYNSCEEIKSATGTTESGEYIINLNNENYTIYCNMSDNKQQFEEKRFSISMLNNPELEIIAPLYLQTYYPSGIWNQTDPLNQNDLNDYQYLIDNNLLHLVRYTTKAHQNADVNQPKNGNLLPRVYASYANRDYREDVSLELQSLPNNPMILVYGLVQSWDGDTDRGRMVFLQLDENDSPIPGTLLDTGRVDFPMARDYRIFTSNLSPEARKFRFYAECLRSAGSECSSDILDFSMVLYPRLPKVGDLVRVR